MSKDHPKTGPARRLRRFLVVAGVLHLALLLVPPCAAPPKTSVERIELELAPLPELAEAPTPEPPKETPALEVQPAPEPVEAIARATPRARPRRRPRATRSEVEPPTVTPPAPAEPAPQPAAETPTEAVTEVSPEAATEAPTEAVAEAPTPNAPPGPRLADVDLFDPTALARAVPGPPPGPATEGARIAARVHGYVRGIQARDRVEVGLVDPYFVDLRGRFAEGFEPAWEDFDPTSAGDDVTDRLQAWGKSYLAEASRYAETGSPYHPGESDQSLFRSDVPGASGAAGRQADLLASALDLHRDLVQGRAGGVRISATVRVIQTAEGELYDVTIEEGSGYSAYDQLALTTVRKTLKEPMTPERQGTGLGLTGERIESVYAFTTTFLVVPPGVGVGSVGGGFSLLSGMGCDLDTNGGIAECNTPFERKVRSKVELLGVY